MARRLLSCVLPRLPSSALACHPSPPRHPKPPSHRKQEAWARLSCALFCETCAPLPFIPVSPGGARPVRPLAASPLFFISRATSKFVCCVFCLLFSRSLCVLFSLRRDAARRALTPRGGAPCNYATPRVLHIFLSKLVKSWGLLHADVYAVRAVPPPPYLTPFHHRRKGDSLYCLAVATVSFRHCFGHCSCPGVVRASSPLLDTAAQLLSSVDGCVVGAFVPVLV